MNKPSAAAPISIKTIAIVYWKLFFALAYYPVIIGAFIWLYVTKAHWGFGLALVGFALWNDPLWRSLLRRLKRRP